MTDSWERGSFRFRVAWDAHGIIEVVWDGHADVAAIRACCAELEKTARGLQAYLLLVDARGVSGYDPETWALARCWSGTATAARARIVAVVVHSQLAAAESPATAMAPPARARLFRSPTLARDYLVHSSSLGAMEEIPGYPAATPSS